MLTVTRTRNGLAYLHVWREGEQYFAQKSGKFLREWTNVIFAAVPQPPIANVHYVDVSRRPLEFADRTFDAANAYHVLEHLTPQEGERFVRELFRVLKPGAICRISVPDLEDLCRAYLRQLEVASKMPTLQNVYRYRWLVMEIFEQMVREKRGGMMWDALCRGEYDREYMAQYYSDVYGPVLNQPPRSALPVPARRTLRQRLEQLTPASAWRSIVWRARAHVRGEKIDPNHPLHTKERVRWMYDRVSLRLLLNRAGFEQIQRKDFASSDIPDWAEYDLDRSNHADRAFDPSVYVEGRVPG